MKAVAFLRRTQQLIKHDVPSAVGELGVRLTPKSRGGAAWKLVERSGALLPPGNCHSNYEKPRVGSDEHHRTINHVLYSTVLPHVPVVLNPVCAHSSLLNGS
jgi:hypothetical protein